MTLTATGEAEAGIGEACAAAGSDATPAAPALPDVLVLLKRQQVLEVAMRARGGIRVTEERELNRLREVLARAPGAVRTILDASRRLDKPLDCLDAGEVAALR